MDLNYLHEQMCDELNGAYDYAKRAIEIRPMGRDWADTFMEMAKQELEHADNMFNFFTQQYAKIISEYSNDVLPAYLKDCEQKVNLKYYEKRPVIKALMEMY